MYIKNAVQYQVKKISTYIMWYYFIYSLIGIFVFIVISAAPNKEMLTINATTNTVTPFLLSVIFLSTYREIMNWLRQNGISAKTVFISLMITACATGIISGIIDFIWMQVINFGMQSISPSITIHPAMYNGESIQNPTVLYTICLNVVFSLISILISAVIMRFGRRGKLAIFVGIPVLLLLVLLLKIFIVDERVLGFAMAVCLNRILSFSAHNMWLTVPICIVVIISATFLVIRRTELKSN